MGYVGLPLMLAFCKAGFRVIGFDIDPTKRARLMRGEAYIKHIPAAAIASAVVKGRLDATIDFGRVAETQVVILCVFTSLDEHHELDLCYVGVTLDSVPPHLLPGNIISLESTKYPGTTDEDVVFRGKSRGLVVGETIFVAYLPERADPGSQKCCRPYIPKVVGGLTPACLQAGAALYCSAFEKVVPVSLCKVGELNSRNYSKTYFDS